jgi:hypothetical protein
MGSAGTAAHRRASQLAGWEITAADADSMIEELRLGKPARRYVSRYSAGNEHFLQSVVERHLKGPSPRGKIRFVSGNFGMGKTHFLQQLREQAFQQHYLVSSVELKEEEVTFDKFEKVFYEIARRIASPEMYQEDELESVTPLGEVFKRTLLGGSSSNEQLASKDDYAEKAHRLLADDTIDPDFRRIVVAYWRTFLPPAHKDALPPDERSNVMRWFAGEGSVAVFRKQFQVQKVVSRENAKLMLRSLSRFAAHIGYRGLLIVFDETGGYYSGMRKTDIKKAQNNLLHLINGIEESPGLFLVYATTPDFYFDERTGILAYGALAQRIGRPEDRPPTALERVWNLDAMQVNAEDYVKAAGKIRRLYLTAYPDESRKIPSERDLAALVRDLLGQHSPFSHVGTWRLIVTGVVSRIDRELGGGGGAAPSSEEIYDRVMADFTPEKR